MRLALAALCLLSTAFACTDTGRCEPCPEELLTNPECVLTGRRMPQICKNERIDYRTCHPKDDQLQVMIFQIIVGLVGGLAFWGVQARKAKSMSLFDQRRKGGGGNFLAL